MSSLRLQTDYLITVSPPRSDEQKLYNSETTAMGTSKDLERQEPVHGAKNQHHSLNQQLSTVPDGGAHAWMTVAGIFLINFATWASNSAYAVFLAHYLQYNTYPDASKLDYAAIGGFCFGSGLFTAPIIRVLVRFVGVRKCMVVGAVVQFVGIMLAAFSTKLWQLYLTQGMLSGIGLALIMVPSLTLIPQWFRKKRSLAASLAATGSGVGGIVLALALEECIQEFGVRWSLIIEAIICAVCVGCALCLVRTRRDIEMTLKIWDWHMLSYLSVWLFILFVSLTLLGFIVILYNLSDFTISLGYSSHQASIVAAMIAVGNVLGRPTVGRLCDLYGPVTTTMFVHLFVGILCFAMWIPARNYATAIAFAIMAGGSAGSLWVVLGVISARIVGLQRLDVLLSMTWVFIGTFGMIAPIIGIELRGTAPDGQAYSPAQYKYPAIWCGAVYFVSSFVLWLTRGYLIARDREGVKHNDHEDNDELHIYVPLKSWVKDLWVKSEIRKV